MSHEYEFDPAVDFEKVTLGEVYRSVLRVEKMLVGNGQPGLVKDVVRNTESIKRLDSGFSALAGQVSNLRATPKREGVKWGAIGGGLISALGGVALAILEALSKKQ